MKNLSILIVLLSIMSIGSAQQDSVANAKWSYEVLVSPNISYRILSNSGNEEWHIKRRNETEIPRYGVSLKFGIMRSFGNRLKVSSGLNYSFIGFKTKATELSWATTTDEYATEIKSSSRYAYMGIPIMAYYLLKDSEKLTTELILGASINQFRYKNVISSIKTNDKWSKAPNKGFRYESANLTGSVGFGSNYKVNDKLFLKINLLFNQSFTATNKLSSTKEYLNFLDLSIGFNYSFNKR